MSGGASRSRLHLPSPETRRRAIWPLGVLGVVAFVAGLVAISRTAATSYARSASGGVLSLGLTVLLLAAGFLARERRARPRHSVLPTLAAWTSLGLAGLFALSSLVGFSGGVSGQDTPQATGSAVDSRLALYLDARWAAKAPSTETGDLTGSNAGGLVVNVDGRSLMFDNFWDAHPNGMAETAEEVHTLALVWSQKVAVGSYTDGATGWRQDDWVRIVDLRTLKVVGDALVTGGDPPDSKSGSGDVTGTAPDLVGFLNRLRPSPSPSESAGD